MDKLVRELSKDKDVQADAAYASQIAMADSTMQHPDKFYSSLFKKSNEEQTMKLINAFWVEDYAYLSKRTYQAIEKH